MAWQLTDEDRVPLRASLEQDWQGTLLRIVNEVGRYALDPVHQELERLRMKHTEPSKRWELVRKTSAAAKSVSFMGDAISHRKRDPEIIIQHLAVLVENDLFHPDSIDRVVKN